MSNKEIEVACKATFVADPEAAVHRVKRCHLLSTQSEVEDGDILCDVLKTATARYGDGSPSYGPVKHDLGIAFAVPLAN